MTFVSRRACLLFAGMILVGCRSRHGRRSDEIEQRIISITPNTTEAVVALGAGDRMVGRSRYCDYPPEVLSLPVVGGYVDPSMEAILALRPDLVVGARGPIGRSLVDKLEARKISCYFPPTESLSEIEAMLLGLGERTGLQDNALALIHSIQQHLANISKSVEGVSQPRTLLVFGQSPIVVAGPRSFPAEMLALSGCRNAVESGTRYPTLGFETILGLDPDMIIDATMAGGKSAAAIDRNRPGWNSVRAVKEGRVARVDDDRILRPGPRVAEGVALIARLTHPGLELP